MSLHVPLPQVTNTQFVDSTCMHPNSWETVGLGASPAGREWNVFTCLFSRSQAEQRWKHLTNLFAHGSIETSYQPFFPRLLYLPSRWSSPMHYFCLFLIWIVQVTNSFQERNFVVDWGGPVCQYPLHGNNTFPSQIYILGTQCNFLQCLCHEAASIHYLTWQQWNMNMFNFLTQGIHPSTCSMVHDHVFGK